MNSSVLLRPLCGIVFLLALLVSSACSHGEAKTIGDVPPKLAAPIKQLVGMAMDAGYEAGQQRLFAQPDLDLDGESGKAMLSYAVAVKELLIAQGVKLPNQDMVIASLATCYATTYCTAVKSTSLQSWRDRTFDSFVVTTYNMTR